MNSEVSLFEAVLQLFHATDPAVVLGYAGKPGARCVDKWGDQWVKNCGKHMKNIGEPRIDRNFTPETWEILESHGFNKLLGLVVFFFTTTI